MVLVYLVFSYKSSKKFTYRSYTDIHHICSHGFVYIRIGLYVQLQIVRKYMDILETLDNIHVSLVTNIRFYLFPCYFR